MDFLKKRGHKNERIDDDISKSRQELQHLDIVYADIIAKARLFGDKHAAYIRSLGDLGRSLRDVYSSRNPQIAPSNIIGDTIPHFIGDFEGLRRDMQVALTLLSKRDEAYSLKVHYENKLKEANVSKSPDRFKRNEMKLDEANRKWLIHDAQCRVSIERTLNPAESYNPMVAAFLTALKMEFHQMETHSGKHSLTEAISLIQKFSNINQGEQSIFLKLDDDDQYEEEKEEDFLPSQKVSGLNIFNNDSVNNSNSTIIRKTSEDYALKNLENALLSSFNGNVISSIRNTSANAPNQTSIEQVPKVRVPPISGLVGAKPPSEASNDLPLSNMNVNANNNINNNNNNDDKLITVNDLNTNNEAGGNVHHNLSSFFGHDEYSDVGGQLTQRDIPVQPFSIRQQQQDHSTGNLANLSSFFSASQSHSMDDANKKLKSTESKFQTSNSLLDDFDIYLSSFERPNNILNNDGPQLDNEKAQKKAPVHPPFVPSLSILGSFSNPDKHDSSDYKAKGSDLVFNNSNNNIISTKITPREHSVFDSVFDALDTLPVQKHAAAPNVRQDLESNMRVDLSTFDPLGLLSPAIPNYESPAAFPLPHLRSNLATPFDNSLSHAQHQTNLLLPFALNSRDTTNHAHGPKTLKWSSGLPAIEEVPSSVFEGGQGGADFDADLVLAKDVLSLPGETPHEDPKSIPPPSIESSVQPRPTPSPSKPVVVIIEKEVPRPSYVRRDGSHSDETIQVRKEVVISGGKSKISFPLPSNLGPMLSQSSPRSRSEPRRINSETVKKSTINDRVEHKKELQTASADEAKQQTESLDHASSHLPPEIVEQLRLGTRQNNKKNKNLNTSENKNQLPHKSKSISATTVMSSNFDDIEKQRLKFDLVEEVLQNKRPQKDMSKSLNSSTSSAVVRARLIGYESKDIPSGSLNPSSKEKVSHLSRLLLEKSRAKNPGTTENPYVEQQWNFLQDIEKDVAKQVAANEELINSMDEDLLGTISHHKQKRQPNLTTNQKKISDTNESPTFLAFSPEVSKQALSFPPGVKNMISNKVSHPHAEEPHAGTSYGTELKVSLNQPSNPFSSAFENNMVTNTTDTNKINNPFSENNTSEQKKVEANVVDNSDNLFKNLFADQQTLKDQNIHQKASVEQAVTRATVLVPNTIDSDPFEGTTFVSAAVPPQPSYHHQPQNFNFQHPHMFAPPQYPTAVNSFTTPIIASNATALPNFSKAAAAQALGLSSLASTSSAAAAMHVQPPPFQGVSRGVQNPFYFNNPTSTFPHQPVVQPGAFTGVSSFGMGQNSYNGSGFIHQPQQQPSPFQPNTFPSAFPGLPQQMSLNTNPFGAPSTYHPNVMMMHGAQINNNPYPFAPIS